MNAPRKDWADLAATDLFAQVQLVPGHTVADCCNVIADALRNERARGYAEGLQARGPVTLGQLARCETSHHRAALSDWAREHLAPADVRDRTNRQRDNPTSPLQGEVQGDFTDTVLAGHPGFAGAGA